MSEKIVLFLTDDLDLVPFFEEEFNKSSIKGIQFGRSENLSLFLKQRITPFAILLDTRGKTEPPPIQFLSLQNQLEGLNQDSIPVLLLISRSKLQLDLLPDEILDFIVDGCSPAELLVRLDKGFEKLGNNESSNHFLLGELFVHFDNWQVKRGDKPIDLTYKEFELFKLFATNPDKVFTRDDLLKNIWGEDYYGGTRTVDVHIRRLRQKMSPVYDQLIQTVRNVGYSFNPDLEVPRSS